MYHMLESIKKEITQTGHMNNKGKIKHITVKNVRWEDILEKADKIYSGMATPCNVQWPLALNPHDTETPSSKYNSNQANLTQFRSNNKSKSKNHTKGNGNGNGKHRGKNGNGKNANRCSKNHKKKEDKEKCIPGSLKFCPPSMTDQPYNHVNGTPVYCRSFNEKKYE